MPTTNYSFLSFVQLAQNKKKTKDFKVISLSNDGDLGHVQYSSTAGAYVFAPKAKGTFGCDELMEIADFCSKTSKEQRQEAARG